MKKLNSEIRHMLIAAIVVTVLFVAGLPVLLLGTSKAFAVAGVNTLFLVTGIVLLAGGFYATPILWVLYGGKRELLGFVSAIENRGLSTLEALASHTRLDADAVRAKIDLCFEKGYLDGYIRDGDTLRRPNPEGELHSVICPACAARFEFRGESGKCPWCGTLYVVKED